MGHGYWQDITHESDSYPLNGCAGHTFSMESLLEDAKRKDVGITWLDLKNGVGSVPHVME